MPRGRNVLKALLFARSKARARRTRRSNQVVPGCDHLEGRVAPAHLGLAHHAVAHLHAHHHAEHASSHASGDSVSNATASTAAASTSAAATSSSTSESTSSPDDSSSSSSSLSTALKTLRDDVQTIELASSTTIGQLAAIQVAFQTLSSDGLSPTSASALKSFENSLVTANASGTDLATDATLLAQFQALYTSSPTTQETADLTAAYNALAAAVKSANVTSADLTTIDTDWAAVLAAKGSRSTTAYPYFSLVTGRADLGLAGPGDDGAGGCM